MSHYLSTPLIGGDLASIINRITTDSKSPLPPSLAIDVTSEFPYFCEGVKLSCNIDKQITVVRFNSQDIQQRL